MKATAIDDLFDQIYLPALQAEWRDFWNQLSIYGSAHAHLDWLTTTAEQYGRGDLVGIIAQALEHTKYWPRLVMDLEPRALMLSDFPRSRLADAVCAKVGKSHLGPGA